MQMFFFFLWSTRDRDREKYAQKQIVTIKLSELSRLIVFCSLSLSLSAFSITTIDPLTLFRLIKLLSQLGDDLLRRQIESSLFLGCWNTFVLSTRNKISSTELRRAASIDCSCIRKTSIFSFRSEFDCVFLSL